MNDPDSFQARIRRLEIEASQAPSRYRVRVAMLGALGYGFLLFVLVMVVAVVLFLLFVMTRMHTMPWVIVKLSWPILIVPIVIVRALRVEIPEPAGLPISHEQTPRLHEMLEQVRSELRAPPPQRVLLTYDFNAGIIQVPRFVFFGKTKNYLWLGVPLMLALSPDALRAVVAHEFGHLSENHGAFGAWIYGIRKTWSQVLVGLERQRSRFDFGLRSFFRWYIPWFNAYSFVLARAQEYVADACAAEVAGRPMACQTLIDVAIMSSYVHESVLPSLYARAKNEPAPPARAFQDMRGVLATGPPAQQAAKSLALALRERTGYEETHPCLFDRLRALQDDDPADARSLEERYRPSGDALTVSAAEHFLGDELARLLETVDANWREGERGEWADQHRAVQEQRGKLTQLDEAAAAGELGPNEAWVRVHATLNLRGFDPGLALLRSFIETHPEEARAHFLLGQLLLSSDDECGVAEVEQAMRIDPQAFIPGCKVIEHFLAAHGRDAEIERLRERMQRFLQDVESSRDERSTLAAGDTFTPHGLPETTVNAMIAFFEALPLRRVLLVRKVDPRFPEVPLWVLGFTVRTRMGLRRSRDIEASVFERLQQHLAQSNDFIFFVIEDDPDIAEALERVEGSTLYEAHTV